ncbi:MAG: pyruvate kinase [bacterium]|nr:pyruvate kinase [bacterium]
MEFTNRHVKIVATVGPACSDKSVLKQMFVAGTDAFRLNASHGKPEELKEWVKRIRQIQDELGCFTGILLDLPGPKLRIGKIDENGIELNNGDLIHLVPEGKSGGIPVGEWSLLQQVHKGEMILMVDGKIQLEVLDVKSENIQVKVINGGRIFSKKGINLPNTTFDIPDLLPQDNQALDAVAKEVDWVALSFVRSAKSADTLRNALEQRDSQACIMAKIERPEAVKQYAEIIEHFDGIMIARGDLGVEVRLEEVPQIQKKLVHAAQISGKASIIATEMLESMIHQFRPTRAEANDVANAVWQYTDAVMLSGETAIGQNPVHVIRTMSKIILEAERELNTEMFLKRQKPQLNTEEAIARAAALIAFDLQAKAIITPTLSGSTPKRVERYRPRTPILATSPNRSVLQQLSIFSGIRGVLLPENAHPVETSLTAVANRNLVHGGDCVVVTGAWPPGSIGTTNFVQVRTIPLTNTKT